MEVLQVYNWSHKQAMLKISIILVQLLLVETSPLSFHWYMRRSLQCFHSATERLYFDNNVLTTVDKTIRSCLDAQSDCHLAVEYYCFLLLFFLLLRSLAVDHSIVSCRASTPGIKGTTTAKWPSRAFVSGKIRFNWRLHQKERPFQSYHCPLTVEFPVPYEVTLRIKGNGYKRFVRVD